ncbi:hypothetical protein GCM10023116_32260 [Kistimonas scapharcae]|uniref:Curli production assembly/transport component CsgG n=1 Tax=Kistimonas scapharcae TaxID=1036133 RepID=A0ABP8V3Z0_9GAMM
MRWLNSIMAMLLLSAPFAMAATVEVDVTGRGLSEAVAVEQGLIEAIRQVNGTDINSVQSTLRQQSRTNGEKETHVESVQGSLLKAKGLIAGYDINDSQCSEAGCEVRLSVRVHQYKAAGMAATNRRKLAVLPFKGSNARFNQRVTEQLQEQLVQSRRFAILDRTHEREFNAEKSLWASENTPVAEKSRLGQVLGLDYMIVGTVKDASVRRWTETVSLTGESRQHARTRAEVRYEIIEVATRQVKWSDTVKMEQNGSSLDQTAVLVAKKVSEQALDNIFPLRVVAVSNGSVILNQGGKTMKQGDRFSIYSLGEKLIDPYTNEVLGRTETKIATVRVVSVSAKMAYAEIVSGSIDDIRVKQIARKLPPLKNTRKVESAPKKESEQLPEEGGVFL